MNEQDDEHVFTPEMFNKWFKDQLGIRLKPIFEECLTIDNDEEVKNDIN